MSEFTGKTVVVTGGTGGIGGGAAIAFARAGAKVVAIGWGKEEIERRRADPDFADIRILELDVTDEAAVNAFAAATPECQVLVNCAGNVIRHGAAFTAEVFQKHYDVHVLGTLRMSTALLPKLEASGAGAIVNTASMTTFFGTATAPAYAAAKGAVGQMTKSMAIGFAPKNVRVNAVAPGWIQTAMAASIEPDFAQRIIQRTPLARWGQPEDLAGPILFLASSAARFVTGVILPVDGGYMAS